MAEQASSGIACIIPEMGIYRSALYANGRIIQAYGSAIRELAQTNISSGDRSKKLRKVFHKHHRDLLSAKFWQNAQQKILAGYVEDFFPYPQEIRFSKCPPETH